MYNTCYQTLYTAQLEAKSDQNDLATRKIKVWDLFRRPRMRIMCFNVMFSWFTVSMVFYGLALNGGNLAGIFYIYGRVGEPAGHGGPH